MLLLLRSVRQTTLLYYYMFGVAREGRSVDTTYRSSGRDEGGSSGRYVAKTLQGFDIGQAELA